MRLSPALRIDNFVRQGIANWKEPYRLIQLHLQLENLTIMESKWTIQSWRCSFSVEKQPYFCCFAVTLFRLNLLSTLFVIRSSQLWERSRLDYQLSSICSLDKPSSSVLGCRFSLDGRIGFCIVPIIGISCSKLKACQPIARWWASASLWVVAPFSKVLFLSFGLLNESMWSCYLAMRS